ncbi:MAG TPA: response regulator, partial [Polyangiaceae bacterium]|nr:response regulator [Polyangiaceae bacterium]
NANGRIREARDGAERIRHVVRELTLFTRDPADGDVATELGEVVRAAVHLSRRTVEANASVRIDPPEEEVWVVGSGPKLGQVCLNLLLNASAAMPSGRGEVVVRWRAFGDRCRLTVVDDGCGMSPDVLARAFEPFFTTRAGSGGTGLGLAMCQNILADLGGTIALDSALGRGTVVTVELRRAQPPREVVSEVPREQAPCRVLVVEDQVRVGRALSRRLRALGHQVEHAADGRQALEILMRPPSFDVVLCDLMMPEMSGQELHAAIVEARPELVERIVFMTGGAFTEDARAFLEGLSTPWLVKPFEDDELIVALAEVAPAPG